MTSIQTTLWAEARHLHQTGDILGAIACYEQLRLGCTEPSVALLQYLGFAYAAHHELVKAISCFEQALLQQPENASLYHDLANAYKQQGNLKQALFHYRNALHAAPDFVAAHYHLGLLLLNMTLLSEATTQFNNVLALSPTHQQAHFYLGILKLNDDDFDAAETHFLAVLAIDNSDVEALVNLGVICIKRDQNQQAINYFTRALLTNAQHQEARHNLAALFMHHDRFENALMYYDSLLKDDPDNTEYHYNSGVAQMALGHLQPAIDHFERVVLRDPNYAAAYNNLGAIHMRLNDNTSAITHLQAALRINPQDKTSQFMLHALSNKDQPIAASPEYVTNLFNNYALYYEQHMQQVLNYTLPEQVATWVKTHVNHPIPYLLDLGCGTGLTGQALRGICTHLTGVDLAPKMLAEARAKGIYDALIGSECIAYLEASVQNYDLITMIDVLPYLDDLNALFQALQKRLTPTGLVIISSEISHTAAFALQDTLRFCHNPDYIKSLSLAHGLTCITQEIYRARQQETKTIDVMMTVLRHWDSA